jgi:hypothetical protein
LNSVLALSPGREGGGGARYLDLSLNSVLALSPGLLKPERSSEGKLLRALPGRRISSVDAKQFQFDTSDQKTRKMFK